MTTSPRADGPDAGDPPGADLFDDAYRSLLAPFHTEADARREVAGLRELLGLAQSDRILDLGCGWGRHLTLLRSAGHEVVGVDLSPALLRQAAEAAEADEAAEAGEPVGAGEAAVAGSRLVAGDMRRLPFQDAAFDVVLNLATSLGLFLDDPPAVEALTEAHRVLRPGGRLLVEGMHRDDVLTGYVERDAWKLDDGTRVRVRRRLNRARAISHEVMRWRDPSGREGSKRHSLRLRSAGELDALLDASGFADRRLFGTWDGEPFDPASPQLVIRARRPAD